MKKHLMYKTKTKELKVTNAKIEGGVYKEYLSNGFEHIGYIDGYNVTVTNKAKIK